MGSEQLEAVRKCTRLTPEDADNLFFPGPGGKSHKAKQFCADCPFISQCLADAIERDLEGFFAGETQESRRQMAAIHHMRVKPLIDELPPEPDRESRVIYLKVFTQPEREWLDQDLEPSPEELLLLDAVM